MELTAPTISKAVVDAGGGVAGRCGPNKARHRPSRKLVVALRGGEVTSFNG
jgi:hypothetical protein